MRGETDDFSVRLVISWRALGATDAREPTRGVAPLTSHVSGQTNLIQPGRGIVLIISRKPVSISFNVISLISNLQIDRRGVDLFTMQSAKVREVQLVQSRW